MAITVIQDHPEKDLRVRLPLCKKYTQYFYYQVYIIIILLSSVCPNLSKHKNRNKTKNKQTNRKAFFQENFGTLFFFAASYLSLRQNQWIEKARWANGASALYL